MTAKIAVHDLHKVFESGTGQVVAALEAIDLSVPAGQFMCIVGPSGCGKSTLLRILAGLEHPSSGQARIEVTRPDRPVNAMVFQEQSTFPWMTVRQNTAFGLEMRGVDRRTRDERVAYYLEKVGLADFANAYPYQLSGGMRQRVCLARAFASEPEVLLMDEPFASLDEQTRILMQEELLRVWEGEHGRSVVFITHSIDEAVLLADVVVLMTARPGRVKATFAVPFPRPRGNLAELKAQPEFGRLTYRVWELLRDEVLSAQAQDMARRAGGAGGEPEGPRWAPTP
ncbi:MAG: ABC transporter ATP-binding protein [Chloroflexi bacterium]|nr:ABC transporter ATP-binding protein [Chloroflexota bacterium]